MIKYAVNSVQQSADESLVRPAVHELEILWPRVFVLPIQKWVILLLKLHKFSKQRCDFERSLRRFLRGHLFPNILEVAILGTNGSPSAGA